MDLEELGKLRLDRLDIGILFSNLRKFIDYAESNLDWQHHAQIQKLSTYASNNYLMLPEIYYSEEMSIAEDYEFVIPNAVRYSALIMLVTYIEWFIKFCKKYKVERKWGEIPTWKKKKTLNSINWLRNRQSEEFTHSFDRRIESLIELRNCIVHDAAIVNSDCQKLAVKQLDGVRLGKFLYMSNLIVFDRGVIEQLTSEAEEWIDSFLDYLDIGDRIPDEFILD